LVIADTHVGSRLAVMPKMYTTKDGQVIRPSQLQLKLLDGFEEMCRWFASPTPDYLILNGDLIDGPQKNELAASLWTANLDEQIDAFVELLVTYFKPTRTLIIRGSDYHELLGGQYITSEEVAKRLSEQCFQVIKKAGKLLTHHQYILTVNNISIHIAHKPISVSKFGHYRQAALLAAELERLDQAIDIAIRSHTHSWCLVETGRSRKCGTRRIMTTPSWQLPTTFVHKLRPEPTADIGAVRLVIEDEHVSVERMLFSVEDTEVKVSSYR